MQSPSAPSSALSYRADIDGLRAISVACVVLRHANVPGFAGGFVGVDVFFVISGYLITALLHSGVSMPVRTQLKQFYWRRARRILPALFACLLVSTAVALFVQLPEQLTAYGRLLAFASVALANIGAHINGGYFAPGTYLSPLRPLWSIAVEEQFYLLYPLAFLLCVRFARGALTTVLLIAVALSLALCIWSSYTHPLLGYYFTPQRAWELLLGALAVLSQDSLRFNRAIRNVLAAASIAVIAVCVALYDSYTRYPGTATLAPAIATACLVVVNRGPEPTFVSKALSWRPLVFTGLISYSIYLWHGPVFDFFQSYAVTPNTPLEIACLIALLYLIAVLSWRWIERPLRSRQVLSDNRAFGITAVAISAALLVSGAVMWQTYGLPARFDSYVQTLSGDRTLKGHAACANPPEEVAAGHLCHFGPDDPAARKVLVWGDSHALVLVPAYAALAQREHLSLYVAMAPTCRPLIGIASAKESYLYADTCRQHNRAIPRAIEVLQPDTIVLNAYWLNPSLELKRDTDRQSISFQEALRATLRSVERPGRQLCGVLDVPHYPYRIPLALGMFHRRGKDAAALMMPRAQADAQQDEVDSAFASVAATNRMRLVNLRDALCSQGACKVTDAEGIPLYVDDNHLSPVGAMIVRDTLAECFRFPANAGEFGGRYRD